MLLGKRPRPPVLRRTTSMSGGMALEPQTTNDELLMSDHNPPHHDIKVDPHLVALGTHNNELVSETKGSSREEYGERLMMGMPLSPTPSDNHRHDHNHTTNTNINTSHFLRTCGLCNRRLAPGRDIYMYRGDTAFCSLECREKQMKQDQRREKWKAGSNKEHHHRASPPTSKASTKSETAACN